MDPDAKLRLLKDLDSKTDWEALILEQRSETGKSTNHQQQMNRKLSKSEKKRMKRERNQEQIQVTLKKRNVETVVFHNPDISTPGQSEQKLPSSRNDLETNTTEGIELDMKKTRFEIMKFGISSLSSKDLEGAESSLAISLGARRNKRPAINYKELQVQRKKERDAAKEQQASLKKPRLKGTAKKKLQAGAKKSSSKQHGRGKPVKEPHGRGRRPKRLSF